MALQFKMIGNFFKIVDTVTSVSYLTEVSTELKYYRDDLDNFKFYNKASDSTNITINEIGVLRKEFPIADIVDGTGTPFADADTCENYLSTTLG